MPRRQFCRKRSGTITEPKLKKHEQNYAGLRKRDVRFKIHKEASSLFPVLTRASAHPVLGTTREESQGRVTK